MAFGHFSGGLFYSVSWMAVVKLLRNHLANVSLHLFELVGGFNSGEQKGGAV